ncbi:hypothetical protein BDR26DRAFT_1003928 [Obelidium mucronatum]|nr:hypothetical protein BDR26DRAFT_1003928 [Obelidium mucronatum]
MADIELGFGLGLGLSEVGSGSGSDGADDSRRAAKRAKSGASRKAPKPKAKKQPKKAAKKTTKPRAKDASAATSVPATIPTLTVREDGIEWIEFTYEVKGQATQFEIRTDIEGVDVDLHMDKDWKIANCIYAGANVPQESYKGNRYEYESSANITGWKLCHINPFLCGQKGLIQRAVDSFRNRFPDLRSRRVVRQEKYLNGTLRQRAIPKTGVATPSLKDSAELNKQSITPYHADQENGAFLQLCTPQFFSPSMGEYHQDTPKPLQTPLLSISAAIQTPNSALPNGNMSSQIAQHLATKSRQPKSLSLETIVAVKPHKLRAQVDIERVDIILSNTPLSAFGIDTSTLVCGGGGGADDAKDNIKRFASSHAFRYGNCVFPRALNGLSNFWEEIKECGLSELYTYYLPNGTVEYDWEGLKLRYEHEVFMNEIAWRIAVLNRKGLTCEEYGGNGCKEFLQRALDVYRLRFFKEE